VAPLTFSAVVTAHDRRTYLAEAVRSAIEAGTDEVIVVRNFSGPIEGCEGRYRDVPCAAAETNEKEARGLETASGDLVGFLDDDDVWDPGKGAQVREVFASGSDRIYYCHSYTPIDEHGAVVTERHPELEARRPDGPVDGTTDDFVRLIGRWPGNNSSTVVRRAWALGTLELVRAAGWAADLTWLATAALSGRTYHIGPERLTRLRLHLAHMSHSASASPAEFRAQHQLSSERFARSADALARAAVARSGAGSAIARYLEERAVGLHFFADLEAGRRARRAALASLAHGPGWSDRGLTGAALVALGSPALARSLLYRASRRRWSRG